MRVLRAFLLSLTLLIFHTTAAYPDTPEAFIEVSIPERTVRVLLPDGTVRQFPVAVPRKTPGRSVYGIVTRVEHWPSWRPTPATRRAYFQQNKEVLPEYLPPGHPKNAMGEWKFVLQFTTKGVNAPIRLHGTNRPEQIGMQISRGCIRMHNADAGEVARITEGLQLRFAILIEPHTLPKPVVSAQNRP